MEETNSLKRSNRSLIRRKKQETRSCCKLFTLNNNKVNKRVSCRGIMCTLETSWMEKAEVKASKRLLNDDQSLGILGNKCLLRPTKPKALPKLS